MSVHCEKLELVQENDVMSSEAADVTNLAVTSILVSSHEQHILLLTSGTVTGGDVSVGAVSSTDNASAHWLARLSQGTFSSSDCHSARPSLFVSKSRTCDDDEYLHRYFINTAYDIVIALYPEAALKLVKAVTRIVAFDVR